MDELAVDELVDAAECAHQLLVALRASTAATRPMVSPRARCIPPPLLLPSLRSLRLLLLTISMPLSKMASDRAIWESTSIIAMHLVLFVESVIMRLSN